MMRSLACDLMILLASIMVANAVPDIYYVLPDDGFYLDCPDINNCHSFEEYVYYADYYFTRGSIFIFMAGNHTLQSELELNGVSNVLLRGCGNEPNTNIVCKLTHNILIVNTENVMLTGLTFLLYSYEHDRQSALYVDFSINLAISNMIFQGTGDLSSALSLTRALYSTSSNISITNCQFIGNTGFEGGAIQATGQSHLVLAGNTFVENRAIRSGGAISIADSQAMSSLIIINSTFIDNFAARDNGGAVNCDSCVLILQGSNNFLNNHCQIKANNYFSDGGGLYIVSGFLWMEDEAYFSHNRAQEGGAIYIVASRVQMQSMDPLSFVNNSEGALAIIRSRVNITGNVIFDANRGQLRGALYIVSSSATFCGRPTSFNNNTGRIGGAVLILEESSLTFAGCTIFDGNTASTGGAIYSANSRLTFHIRVIFNSNRAVENGGGLYASETNMTLEVAGTMELQSNFARNGGGMYLRGRSSLNLEYRSNLTIYNNYANDYGGGIYHEDSPTLTQCTLGEITNDADRLSCGVARCRK